MERVKADRSRCVVLVLVRVRVEAGRGTSRLTLAVTTKKNISTVMVMMTAR